MKTQKQNKALFDAKRLIAQIVTDVVNLEDINYTVPEVQTLLDGITVGGHKLQDELITLNQIKAWRYLFIAIEDGTFEFNKDYVLRLHNLVANQEALTWGEFRTGQVSISGTDYLPPKATELNQLWNNLEQDINQRLLLSQMMIIEVYRAAVLLFAKMARIQFFFDGNKRTARMMMSGVLLSCGLPMINIPAKHKLEFNQVMIKYYDSEDFELLFNFMYSCIPDYVKEEYDLPNI